MKKSKLFKYRDYFGSTDFDLENEILYGEILFINDTITYEATNLQDLRTEFEAAVDDYLETCSALNRTPHKTCSGSFNIRLGEDLHREAVLCAMDRGQYLNDFCREAIEDKIRATKEAEKESSPAIAIKIVDQSEAETYRISGQGRIQYTLFENGIEESGFSKQH